MLGFGLLALRVGGVALVFLLAGANGALAQQRVGVSGAVNPEATSRPPGGTVRKLVIGQEIVFNERITTEANGQTQLLFLDQSSMSIGPNSDLTIDQFVYDPKTGTGKLAMSATRGLLRYVGGKLSSRRRRDAAHQHRPWRCAAERSSRTSPPPGRCFHLRKELRLPARGGPRDPAGLSQHHRGGRPPSPPGPTPRGLAEFTQALDGCTGGTGAVGAGNIPTDTSVANSGIGNDLRQLQRKPAAIDAKPRFTQPIFSRPFNPIPNTITSQPELLLVRRRRSFLAGGSPPSAPRRPAPPRPRRPRRRPHAAPDIAGQPQLCGTAQKHQRHGTAQGFAARPPTAISPMPTAR